MVVAHLVLLAQLVLAHPQVRLAKLEAHPHRVFPPRTRDQVRALVLAPHSGRGRRQNRQCLNRRVRRVHRECIQAADGEV